MFINRPEVVLLVYGKGGHAAQMQRFIDNAPAELKNKQFIVLSDIKTRQANALQQYYCIEARDKYSYIKNIFIFFLHMCEMVVQMSRILANYKVVAMISTGPGIAVIPALFCRVLRAKVIYFESWSRVFTPSLAGKMMYRIANLFFIQHQSLKKFYPKSLFFGRL